MAALRKRKRESIVSSSIVDEDLNDLYVFLKSQTEKIGHQTRFGKRVLAILRRNLQMGRCQTEDGPKHLQEVLFLGPVGKLDFFGLHWSHHNHKGKRMEFECSGCGRCRTDRCLTFTGRYMKDQETADAELNFGSHCADRFLALTQLTDRLVLATNQIASHAESIAPAQDSTLSASNSVSLVENRPNLAQQMPWNQLKAIWDDVRPLMQIVENKPYSNKQKQAVADELEGADEIDLDDLDEQDKATLERQNALDALNIEEDDDKFIVDDDEDEDEADDEDYEDEEGETTKPKDEGKGDADDDDEEEEEDTEKEDDLEKLAAEEKGEAVEDSPVVAEPRRPPTRSMTKKAASAVTQVTKPQELDTAQRLSSFASGTQVTKPRRLRKVIEEEEDEETTNVPDTAVGVDANAQQNVHESSPFEDGEIVDVPTPEMDTNDDTVVDLPAVVSDS